MTKKSENIEDLPMIGWREWVKLPELGVNWIKVKVDTGARSSAIHAFDLEEFNKGNDKWVRFKVFTAQRSEKKVVETEAKILEYRSVRNSGGIAEMRPVIITTMKLLDMDWEIELTLANRDGMGFRMLLGRQAVRRNLVIDPGGSYYSRKPKRKKKKSKKS
ncbi:MAG: ATP-dependent zinc protease [Mariniblastus sp.]